MKHSHDRTIGEMGMKRRRGRTNLTHSLHMTVTALALVLLISSFIPCTRADREHDLEYISRSGIIPNFANYTTPTIEQGDNGILKFTIHNRYDSNISDVTLITDIHLWSTIESSGNVSGMDDRPGFTPGQEYDVSESGNTVYQNWSIIEVNSSQHVEYSIKAGGDTPGRTYFVRVELSFEYNGTGENSTYIMKSHGFFSSELWEEATTPHEGDSPGAHSGTGNVNLTVLGVDGVLPDTSFRVKGSGLDSDSDSDASPGMVAMPAVGFAALVMAAYQRRKGRNRQI